MNVTSSDVQGLDITSANVLTFLLCGSELGDPTLTVLYSTGHKLSHKSSKLLIYAVYSVLLVWRTEPFIIVKLKRSCEELCKCVGFCISILCIGCAWL